MWKWTIQRATESPDQVDRTGLLRVEGKAGLLNQVQVL